MERRQIELALEDVLQKVRHNERARGASRSSVKPKKEERKGTQQERRKRKQRLGKKERHASRRRNGRSH